MQIALSGLLFDAQPFGEFVATARATGCAAVELRGTRLQLPPDAPPERASELALALNGLPVANLATHVGNFALLDDADAELQYALAARYVRWAAFLRATSLRVWPGWIASSEADPEHWARAARQLRRLAQGAAEQGVRVAIELHHGTLADSADGAHRLLDAVAHPAVGLVLDPANLMQTPAPFGAAAVDALGDRLLHVHVKDHAIVPGGDPGAYPFRDYLRHIGQWVPRMEVPRLRQGPPWYAKRSLGDGHVPWPAILARLRERGYGGYLILESEAGPGMPTGHELARQDAATLTRWIGSA